MKVELSAEEIQFAVEALEHLAAYYKTRDRDSRPLQELADRLKRQGKREG